MFESLYDEISRLWSWRWPVVEGTITAVDVEEVRRNQLRLAVAYMFSVGDDGPYTGESFWTPAFSITQRSTIRAAKKAIRVGRSIRVRYRPDDPSVNTLEGGVRRLR
jgi:hypothetical protein